ncbi:MAG: GntR family transcriptional regulator [Euzebyales bacterium]|nr:GntR family transcriptional regulator [Euzebyales bacterium]
MVTIAERAYLEIRARVLAGDYPGGSRLREEELAKAVGVSRTPVREALRRLDAEGLVEFVPNRGAHVAAWSEDDLAEIFGLRTVLEGYGARLCARKVAASDLEELCALAEQMESLASRGVDGHYDEMAVLNHRFHRLVIEAAGNKRLAGLLDSLVQFPLQHRTLRQYSDERLARSMAQHRELVQALATGDGEWAEAAMRAHVLGAQHSLEPMQAPVEGLSA